MGKGGLNRLLLRATDLTGTSVKLPPDDIRAEHIRTVLCGESNVVTLRLAVEGQFLHNGATAQVAQDGSVIIEIPIEGRQHLLERAKVVLLVAMQRPKVIARVIEAAACVGVEGIVIVGAEKVEKSYWQCRLFREDNIVDDHGDVEEDEQTAEDGLPGRARKAGERYDGRPKRRRVEDLRMVRRRLEIAVEQGCVDGTVPWVMLEPNGVASGMQCIKERSGGDVSGWTKVVAHVGGEESITRVVEGGDKLGGVVIGIGPEGGWTKGEVTQLTEMGFRVVGLGERVLRSETAVVIGLGLVHEGMRLKKEELQ